MEILSTSNLSLRLGNKQVLNNINLSLGAGRVYAIIGPNGAGKSSLLKSLCGEIISFTGHLRFGGKALSDLNSIDLARAMAMLPQSSNLNFPFTVREVVSLARTPHCSGKHIDEQIISEAINAMDMHKLQQRLYTQLSGGEKQRTQVARVLAQIWREKDSGGLPRILLLDEPTAFLDMGHQQQLLQQVTRFGENGASVVMVLHDINLAANFSDEIVAMQAGEVIAAGESHKILTVDLIETLFSARIDLLRRESQPSHYVLQR